MIHGDIKPQNVLVFKDATGKTTIKMADFGYSTLAAGEAGRVLLPKSRPWSAPEHHWGEFTVPEAKKTDVYSFGLLCLWVLFGNHLSDIPSHNPQCEKVSASFDASTGPLTVLEQLKAEDRIGDIADQLLQSLPDTELTSRLKEFFNCTVRLDPKKRTSDVRKLVDFLSQEQ